jgi:5'-AMP-activated protein kinase catalytic alpha subunit
MICGYLPFEDPETALLYQKILKGEFVLPDHVSKEAGDILGNILKTDPDLRYSE